MKQRESFSSFFFRSLSSLLAFTNKETFRRCFQRVATFFWATFTFTLAATLFADETNLQFGKTLSEKNVDQFVENDGEKIVETNEEATNDGFLASFSNGKFGGSLVFSAQQATANAVKSGIAGAFSLDLELTVPISERTTLFGALELGNGSGLDARIPTETGFNADAGADAKLGLLELWLERNWARETLRTQAGYVDLTNWFDCNEYANCENTQFLSPAFVNSSTFAPSGNSLGGVVWWTPSPYWDAGVGYCEEANDNLDDLFSAGIAVAEIALRPNFADRKGNYRADVWFDSAPRTEIGGTGRDNLTNFGLGFSFDQEITARLGVFARLGKRRAAVSKFDRSFSCGCQYRPFDVEKRSDDRFGFAFGRVFLGRVDANFFNLNFPCRKRMIRYCSRYETHTPTI